MKSIAAQIQSLLSTAETYTSKGDRVWARAVNGGEGYLYQQARECYDRAARCIEHANILRNK